MKYLGFFLLTLPLISSCVEHEHYYEQGYYNPPSQVEVHRIPPTRHFHENTAAPQERVYSSHVQGHPNEVTVPGQVRPHQYQGQRDTMHGHTQANKGPTHVNNSATKRSQHPSNNKAEENLHGHY